jgi:hypothetical protein
MRGHGGGAKRKGKGGNERREVREAVRLEWRRW